MHDQQNGDDGASCSSGGTSPPASQMSSLPVNTPCPIGRPPARWATGSVTPRASRSPSGSHAVGTVVDETQQHMACDGGGGERSPGLHGVVLAASHRTPPAPPGSCTMVWTAWGPCRHCTSCIAEAVTERSSCTAAAAMWYVTSCDLGSLNWLTASYFL